MAHWMLRSVHAFSWTIGTWLRTIRPHYKFPYVLAEANALPGVGFASVFVSPSPANGGETYVLYVLSTTQSLIYEFDYDPTTCTLSSFVPDYEALLREETKSSHKHVCK